MQDSPGPTRYSKNSRPDSVNMPTRTAPFNTGRYGRHAAPGWNTRAPAGSRANSAASIMRRGVGGFGETRNWPKKPVGENTENYG